MKIKSKNILFSIILVLLFGIMTCLPCYTVCASENQKVVVSDAEAQCTQMVYLTVSLQDCKKANTLGISMDYDASILTKVASECTWARDGVLQDFDIASNIGVWATKKAENLNGDICTLAFRVKPDAPVGDTKVTCEVIVKNNSKELGTYTAVGTVRVICEHSYGEWIEKNSAEHKRICKHCESEETTIHVWDTGEVIQKPTKTETGWKLYRCKDCGTEKREAITIQDELEQNKPTDSEQSAGSDLSKLPDLNKEPSQTKPSGTIKNPNKMEESNIQNGPIMSWLSNLAQNSSKTDTVDMHDHSDKMEDLDIEEPAVLSESEGVTEHIHSEACDHSAEDTEHVDVTDRHYAGYLIVGVIVVVGLMVFVYKKRKNGR